MSSERMTHAGMYYEVLSPMQPSVLRPGRDNRCRGLCARFGSKRGYMNGRFCKKCDMFIDRIFVIKEVCPCCKFRVRKKARHQ